MATEAIAITGILIVCSVAIIIGDAAVSGILAWVSCITFKSSYALKQFSGNDVRQQKRLENL